MDVLDTSSAMEFVPVFFVIDSWRPRNVEMHQLGSEEEDCLQVNVEVNV